MNSSPRLSDILGESFGHLTKQVIKIFPPSVAMRTYLSTHLLWAAEHFAELANGIEDDYNGKPTFDIVHRAYAVSSVVAAVAFLEAVINELFLDVCVDHESYIGVLDSRKGTALKVYWRESDGRASILEKYQEALNLTGHSTFDRGAPPFQDAALLVKLRNRLVHFRPKTVGTEMVEKFEKSLGDKFAMNKLMDGARNPYFPDKCLGAGCARWAATTARALADEAHRRLGVVPNYQRVQLRSEGRPDTDLNTDCQEE